MGYNLLVGAGKAEIRYTEEIFPTADENYIGIHDLPMLQVLMLQCGESFAVISVGNVVVNIAELLRPVAAEALEIPEDHILLQATHVLSTPHFALEENSLLTEIHVEALKKACRTAKASLRPATWGYGTAFAPVNVNRTVETANGWWQGINLDGPADQNVPVLRFDSREGKPIAILYNCNVVPACMEFSETMNGGRLVSGDLASNSERFIDRMFDDVVSIYITGFTGDMWPVLRARLDYIDKDGNQKVEDLHEAGFALMQTLSVRLGEQVVKTAKEIKTAELKTPIRLDKYHFSYDGQEVSGGNMQQPTKECRYIINGTQEAEIGILQIEDTAIVSCGVELCYETVSRIKEQSPFRNTFLMEFAEKGGGYLPEKVFYDRRSYQSRKCRYAQGTAEKFAEDIIESLQKSFQNQQ